MRKPLLLALLTLSILFGCKESEDATHSVGSTYSLSDSTFTWNSNVNQQMLKITTSSKWTATSSVSWCDPLIASGTGTTSIPIWVSPNITSEARSGTLTLTCNTAKITIPVSQPAYSSDTDYVYRLPVVFHIMYKDASDSLQYVKNGWMAKVLHVVNEYYKYNNTNIQFEMAKYDEDGNMLSEPGVMRQQVSFDSYDYSQFLGYNNASASDLKEFSKNAQNMKRYINVYVYNFKQSSTKSITLGVSDIAVLPTAHALDGCFNSDYGNTISSLQYPFGSCINNQCIYEVSDGVHYNSCNIVVTLAHELGHYVGLLHSFSADECNDDDYCTDTHNCDYTSYVNNIETQRDSVIKKYGSKNVSVKMMARRMGCDGTEYVADNIMDYAYCLSDTFTTQQVARMKHVMNYGSLIPGPKLDSDLFEGYTRSSAETTFTPLISSCPAIPKPETTRGGDSSIRLTVGKTFKTE